MSIVDLKGAPIVSLDQMRAEQCLGEINAVLQKFNCAIDPVITLTSRGVVQGQWMVVAIPAVPADLKGGVNGKTSEN